MDKVARQNKAAAGLKKNSAIGFGAFLGMTASMVLTVYEYPTFAEGGWSLILFLLVAGFCFFLPIALAAAEMGTVRKWRKLGVYIWARDTLGPQWGFYAIFGQWAEITVGFIAMMYAIVSGFGFVFGGTAGFDLLTENSSAWYGNYISTQELAWASPSALYIPITTVSDGHGFIAQVFIDGHWISADNFRFSQLQLTGQASNGAIVKSSGGNSASLEALQSNAPLTNIEVAGAIFGVGIGIFLILVVGALFGAEWVSKYSKWAFWGGIGIPTFIVVVLGIIYVAQGHNVFTMGSWDGTGTQGSEFTRGMNGIASFGVFAAVIVAFAGPESSASLANRLKNVNRNYPLAIILLLFLSVSFGCFAGIFIAISTQGTVNQSGGLTITFITLFLLVDPHMSVPMAESATRVITLAICLGLVGQIMSWLLGPSTGMHIAAKDGLIPAWFKKVNRFEVPWTLVLVQTIGVIIFEAIITLGLGAVGSGSFSAGLQVTVLIYMMTYMLLFISHMRMWAKAPDIPRAFDLKKKWLGFGIGFLGWLCVTFAWCAAWLNVDGVPNQVWFPVLVCIWGFAVIMGVGIYHGMKAWTIEKILKKYGFNKDAYSFAGLKVAKAQFLMKLEEQKVPEVINNPFTGVKLENATPEEIQAEVELKKAEKAELKVKK